jgi:O-antigen/teichoic acid export membrane protein
LTTESFTNSARWATFSAFLTKCIAIGLSLWLANELTRLNFSLIGLYQTTLTLAAVYANVGLAAIATKHISNLQVSNPQRIGGVIALTRGAAVVTSLVIALVFVTGADYFAKKVFSDSHIKLALFAAAAAVMFASLNAVQVGVLSAFNQFKAISIANIALSITSVPVTILLTSYVGVRGALGALVALQALQFLGCEQLVRRALKDNNISFRWREAIPNLRLLRSDGLAPVASNFLIGLIAWLVLGMVTKAAGLEELAAFNIANQWRTAVLFIPAAIGPLLLTKFSRLNALEVDGFGHLKKSVTAVGIAGCASFIVIFAVTDPLLAAYGIAYTKYTEAFIIAVFSSIPTAISGVLTRYIYANSGAGPVAMSELIWSLVYVVVAIALVEANGAYGASIALSVAAIAQLSYNWHYVSLRLRKGWY